MKNKNVRKYYRIAFKGKGKYTKTLSYCLYNGCNASLGWHKTMYKSSAYCRACRRKIIMEKDFIRYPLFNKDKRRYRNVASQLIWNNQFIGSPSVYEFKQPPIKVDMTKVRQPGWRHEFLQNRLFVEDHKPSKEQLGKVFQEFAPWNENDYLKAKELINNIKQ